MTEIQAARPHAAVHSIDHFALNVPSVADAARFYRAFGLGVETSDDGTELELRAADGHRWARILPAAAKSLAYLSFNCYARDFDALARQVEQSGAVRADAPPGAESGGLWFHDPDGNLLQVRVGPKTSPSPSAKAPHVTVGAGANARGAVMRSQVQTIHPERLSHVLLFTPDVLRAIDFYARAIGLRLSDKSLDIIAFTHAPHGSDHHLVAFAKSGARGWHHAAWDVRDLDMVGQGAAQMAAAGYTHGWGTGRHVLGSNYFHYVQDPWGSFNEYSADIDFVAADHPWPAGDFAPEDSLYQWGPDVPSDFIHNTEAPDSPVH
ncbi:VOC family protein [Cupriavidus sp. AcVe19-6a]|uniref:VOC family protein n=1 Tax=Cupriavidus sp. AcVe19-6a TaxID=2821358 RepID=UPI001AE6F713|nr:VOC family protein [Cupriavidus sp. AcVe19-6a]MBP0638826.1 VOC family protein [Cupriavidus sp. AcVe19-6a]